MRPFRITTPLCCALLAAAGQALAQDRLVLQEGVLELKRTRAQNRTIYTNAYFSPYENLDTRVLAVLEQAKPGSTVYMSYYSISFQAYPEMYKKLKAKGVTVRLNLYEREAIPPDKRMDDDLVAAGFDVALIPNLRHPVGQASMHTKFTVVNDELIVTGSANLSASASLANHEHIVVLKDKTLARYYKTEWNEQRAAAETMRKALTPDEWRRYNESLSDPFPADWTKGGSSSRAAKLASALRAVDVTSQNKHPLIQTWFSPEDQLDRRCAEQLRKAQRTIKVAMYTFVNGLVTDLVDAARRGVKVTVIADDHQQQMEHAEWVNEALEGEPNIKYVRASNHLGLYSSIHHKYALIDDEVVLGGSYNWTASATRYNDENLVVIRSKELGARFAGDFAAMLNEFDPEGGHVAPTMEGTEGRVLFAIEVPFEVKKGYSVVVEMSDAAGKTRRLDLRTSRSVGQNWLGSESFPRGQPFTWRVGIVKTAGIAGNVAGDASAVLWETGAARPKLVIAADGVARIIHEKWLGAAPTME